MIDVFVTFDFDSADEERVRKVAAEARGMFEGMASLRNKFFSDQLLHRVTDLYGVRPQVEFAEIIELVDNAG